MPDLAASSPPASAGDARGVAATVLGLAGTANRTSLAWFRITLLLAIGVQALFMHRFEMQLGSRLSPLVLPGIMVCGLAALVPVLRHPATRLAAALLFVAIVLEFPVTANHTFLVLLGLGLLAFFDDSVDEEARLLGQGLRWLTVIFLFYSGLQKVLYGYYFDGQYLGYSTALDDGFAKFFRPFLPGEEFERLRGQARIQPGAGPFRVASLPFLVLSNAVYVMEMTVPVLLLVKRTRVIGAVLGLGLVIGIELAAREVFFGVLAINLLLLFLPGPWNRRLFPLFAAFLLYLAGVAFGLLPNFTIKI